MLTSFKRLVSLSVLGLLFYTGCVSPELSSARLYMKQQEWENAENSLLQALKNEPENAEIPARLGEVYGELEQWDKMNEMFDLALSVNKDFVLEQYQVSVKDFVAIKRNEYWVPVARKAVEHFNAYLNGDPEEKELEIQNAVNGLILAQKIDPSNAQSFSRLANIYLLRGNIEEARKQILTALELQEDDYWSFMIAARIFREMNDFNTAIEYAEKATRIDTTKGTAVRLLAELYYKEGMVEEAISAFERAIKATDDRKDKADLYFNLGLLFQESDDLDRAEEFFSQAYELNPDDAEALLGMAHTFEQAEKWRTAERYYGYLLDIDPDNPEYNRGKAITLMRQGKPERAQRYFLKYKAAIEPE